MKFGFKDERAKDQVKCSSSTSSFSGADLFNWIFTGAQFALLLQVRNGRVKGAAFISSVDGFILVEIQVHETRSQFGLLIRSGPTFGQQLARFPLFRK